MPFHADARQFSEGANIHAKLEGIWEDEIKKHYLIDDANERFYYDLKGLPMRNLKEDAAYQTSFLKTVEEKLATRDFIRSYGDGNDDILGFATAVCQYAYLMSYELIPAGYDHTNVTSGNWDTLGKVKVGDLHLAVLSDAVDSLARVWLRIWARYVDSLL